jgi:hypothetical protein
VICLNDFAYFESVPLTIAESLQRLETETIALIAERIYAVEQRRIARGLTDYRLLNSDSAFLIQKLREIQLFQRDYAQMLSDAAAKLGADINREIIQAAIEIHNADEYAYSIGNKLFVPYERNNYLQQLTFNLSQHTHQTLYNITRTTGFVWAGGQLLLPHTTLNNVLDYTMLQVTTGVSDYGSAIKQAVKKLSDSGLRTVDYASGRKISIEAAARTAVITGISQMAGDIANRHIAELGTRYVAVSMHDGARTGEGVSDHQKWQGKVYRLSDEFFRNMGVAPPAENILEKPLTNDSGGGIMSDTGDINNMNEVDNRTFDAEVERQKILDGTYPSRIIQGRQNKHIAGTREFEQKSEAMEKESPRNKPSVIEADVKILVDRYKGTGHINISTNSPYPVEIIDTDTIIGKTWVRHLQKYTETKRIKIIYSSKGVHVVPINDYAPIKKYE